MPGKLKTILQRGDEEILEDRTTVVNAIGDLLDSAATCEDDNETALMLTTVRIAVETQIMHALWDITDILRTRP